MTVSPLYIRHQVPVIMALLKTGLGPALEKIGIKPHDQNPIVEEELSPRPIKLIGDYIRHVGGDSAWYRNTLPPHLFPQWGFPLMAKTLVGQPYNLTKVLNGGASYKVNKPLPANEPLKVRATLASVDESESRVLLQQKLVTGTESVPEALECTVNAIIPKKQEKKGVKKAPLLVPKTAREVAAIDLKEDSGLDFALLTGDFNPIHWIPSYAKMAGFPNTILHGFGSMARTIEALNRNMFGQAPYTIKSFECRFMRPLVLPAKVHVYVEGDQVYLGSAPETKPFLQGVFTI